MQKKGERVMRKKEEAAKKYEFTTWRWRDDKREESEDWNELKKLGREGYHVVASYDAYLLLEREITDSTEKEENTLAFECD